MEEEEEEEEEEDKEEKEEEEEEETDIKEADRNNKPFKIDDYGGIGGGAKKFPAPLAGTGCLREMVPSTCLKKIQWAN